MSAHEALLLAYRELETLNQQALEQLQSGLDFERLSPLFERKAALSAFIGANPIGILETDSETLRSLLDAQSTALNAESRLGQALQTLVSSFGNSNAGSKNVKGLDLGRRWDYSG